MKWPDLDNLASHVDTAVSSVRLYMYPLRSPLAEKVGYDLNYSGHLALKQRRKHPWMDLEPLFWKHLPDAVWTEDPRQATFFVIPHTVHAHRVAVDTLPITKAHLRNGLLPLLNSIYHETPYYNRSGGADHILVWVAENGMRCDCNLRMALSGEPLAWRMLESVIRVGYWAHDDVEVFGWRLDHDVAVPQWGAVSLTAAPPPSWQSIVADRRGVSGRRWSFGFHGSYWGTGYTCKAVTGALHMNSSSAYCACSSGVRFWLQHYMQDQCVNATSSGSRASEAAATDGLPGRCSLDPGQNAMGSAWFALCPAAWACWSSRLYHAIDRMVVPVVLADGARQPFESIFEWRRFSVTLDVQSLMRQSPRSKSATGSRTESPTALDELHDQARAAARACASCQECEPCQRIGLVQKLQRLARVRRWLLYNTSTTYSVAGLFLLELRCRDLWRQGQPAPCKRLRPGAR